MITFSSFGGSLQGVSHNPATGEETPLANIVLNGNRLTWSQEVTQPIRGNSLFDMQVNDNTLSGTVKMGGMPIEADVTAKRIH